MSFTDLDQGNEMIIFNFNQFWTELHFFEAAEAVVKIGSSFKSTNFSQIQLN